MSCYLCSPPANLLISGQWSPQIHQHHVKEFHLGEYKPFKCQPVRHGYLEGLTDVMLQYNTYSTDNSPDLARDMVNAIQAQVEQPENENQTEAPTLTRDKNSQVQDDQASETQPMRNEANKVAVQKKKNDTRKTPKKSANLESSPASISLCRKQKVYYYCIECEQKFTRHFITQHIAKAHIKKPILACDVCNYTISDWHLGSMRRHVGVGGVHDGNATYSDMRAEYIEQLGELRYKLIKRADGTQIRPYRNQLKLNAKNESVSENVM